MNEIEKERIIDLISFGCCQSCAKFVLHFFGKEFNATELVNKRLTIMEEVEKANELKDFMGLHC